MATVTNTAISFSPDMNTLYLIDGARVIPYALNRRNGVLVTVLRGQITVVTAPDVDPEPEPQPDPNTENENMRSLRATADPGNPAYPQRLVVSVTGNQFNLFFNPPNQALGIIGATDIGGAIARQEPPDTIISIFLLRDRILNIRRVADRLEMVLIKS